MPTIGVLNLAIAGVQNATQKAEKAAGRIHTQSARPEGTLVRDLIEMKTARVAFEANLEVIRTFEELEGMVIDLFA